MLPAKTKTTAEKTGDTIVGLLFASFWIWQAYTYSADPKKTQLYWTFGHNAAVEQVCGVAPYIAPDAPINSLWWWEKLFQRGQIEDARQAVLRDAAGSEKKAAWCRANL